MVAEAPAGTEQRLTLGGADQIVADDDTPTCHECLQHPAQGEIDPRRPVRPFFHQAASTDGPRERTSQQLVSTRCGGERAIAGKGGGDVANNSGGIVAGGTLRDLDRSTACPAAEQPPEAADVKGEAARP
jgi:hypothetical protein